MTHQDLHAQRGNSLLTAAGLDEVLVFGAPRVMGTGTQAFPNFYHLLGVDTGNAIALGHLRRGGSTRVFSPNFFLIDDLEAGPPTEIGFIWAPWHEFGETIAHAIGSGGPIGLLGATEMPMRMWAAITAQIDAARFVDLDALSARLRILPDAVQMRDHASAAVIVDALFDRLPAMARNGEPTWMLQRRLEAEAMLRGADQCVCWMTTAPAADYYRTAKTVALRVPEDGDQLLLGVMLTVNGAWGHGIRTYHLGPPRAALLALHQGIAEVQREVVALLRPGARLTTANDAIEALYRKVFPGVVETGRRFRTVHGLGFSYEEPASSPMFRQPFERPQASETASAETAAGMLFEVHPNLFLPEVGGVAIGDMLMIAEGENEYLTRYPRSLHVV